MTRHTGNTTIGRRLQATAAIMLSALLVWLLAPAPAQAVPPASGPYIAANAPVRACIDLAKPGCTRTLWTAPKDAGVKMQCWQDGSWWTGLYRTNRWFLIKYGSKEGWVHASHVKRQSTVGWCGNSVRVKAATQAAIRTGQIYADSKVAQMFSASSWAPGPYGEWSGDCVKLGLAAYRLAGRDPLNRSTAYYQYLAYKDAGRIKTGTPLVGALVFYGKTASNAAGHVAVSVGGGYVATTVGLDGARKANTINTVANASSGTYLGWALP